MNYYKKAFQHYADFRGRARRSEYWYFVLFNFIFAIAAMLLDNLLGISFGGIGYGFIYLAYGLVTLVPGLAVMVRRLHDVGKSGWMFLVVLIPIIGAIWLLVLLFTDSVPGENKWGPNPKETEAFSFEENSAPGAV
jgi:uncharacterized membrane protein YhaH (DUF805 family)